MVKSYWVVVVAYRILVSAQGLLVLGLGLKGLGLRVWVDNKFKDPISPKGTGLTLKSCWPPPTTHLGMKEG